MDPVNIPRGFILAPTPGAASKRLLPWLVAVAFFMESLDTTILNTAGTGYFGGSACGSAEHEVGAGPATR